MAKETSSGPIWELALRQRSWLLFRARKLCGNEADAEDLIQETFSRFGKALSQDASLLTEKVISAWLLRTLTNFFYDQCRKKKVRELGATDPTLANELAQAQQHVTSMLTGVTDDQFDQAVQQLPSEMRKAFELHIARHSNEDIAHILGIKPGTVRKRLHDARAKLRELLKRDLNMDVLQ